MKFPIAAGRQLQKNVLAKKLASVVEPDSKNALQQRGPVDDFWRASADRFAVLSAADSLPDPLLGEYSRIGGLLHAAIALDGRVREEALAEYLSHVDHLHVLVGVRLPIMAGAEDMVRSNPEAVVADLRRSVTGQIEETYSADLIVVDRRTQLCLVIDCKRNAADPRVTGFKRLVMRMRAASLTVPEILHRSHRISVTEVLPAIVDFGGHITGSDWILNLADLERLLAAPGLVAEMDRLVKLCRDALANRIAAALPVSAGADQREPCSRMSITQTVDQLPERVDRGAAVTRLITMESLRARLREAG